MSGKKPVDDKDEDIIVLGDDLPAIDDLIEDHDAGDGDVLDISALFDGDSVSNSDDVFSLEADGKDPETETAANVDSYPPLGAEAEPAQMTDAIIKVLYEPDNGSDGGTAI